MKTHKEQIWTWLLLALFISLIPMMVVQANDNSISMPTILKEVIPLPVQKLFEWPAQSTLDGPNHIDSKGEEVVYPNKQCLSWITKVFSPSWLPAEDIKLIFIRNEFDGRDTVRASWQRNGYNIQVSQTASIFTIKLTPVKSVDLGVDKLQKIEIAKRVCLDIFNETGIRWSADERGAGIKVTINDLNKKIASYSFEAELSKYLKGDNSVLGRPKTASEAKAERPTDDIESKKQIAPDNPDWENTAYAYAYWFRMVNWFNDGSSIGYYFFKVEDGAWGPNYADSIDKDFFGIRSPHHVVSPLKK